MLVLSKPKILLSGIPGCGNTTLIKKVIDKLDRPVYGFFTKEIRKGGRRVGFEFETFNKPPDKGILSHINIKSKYRVGKYGVDLNAFEKTVIPEIENGIKQAGLIVIDEIGKMELFSERFKDLLGRLFNMESSKAIRQELLATILYRPHPFCDRLKNSRELRLIIVNTDNRDLLVDELVAVFS